MDSRRLKEEYADIEMGLATQSQSHSLAVIENESLPHSQFGILYAWVKFFIKWIQN